MKSDNPFRHFAIPFGIAVLVYIIFYAGIEHRRTRKGPWEITFTNDSSGAPALVINEPNVGVTNLQISFPGETNRIEKTSLTFGQPREVPYDIPFGKCVFMDTTFLPGTIVFDLFGHEIQLIPRVLTIDKKEIPWQSEKTIAVNGTNSAPATR
jgi:hypothetical protein